MDNIAANNANAFESIKLLTSKLEYIQALYKDSKKKLNDLTIEKVKLEQNYQVKLELENEKVEILNRQIKDLEVNIAKKNDQLKFLTESNKNLLSEVSMLNVNNNDLKKTNEVKVAELDFSKKELEK